ncbi:PhzF family phenazine biosynthesis isomerase [Mycoplasma sp. P36-A1]|uniref:PhzF family phenazine biosynthesis isomerase n=1 Tax=Mycoplasma sp. P36-A1 TaxID=3252900 RepID=UPI003C2E6BC7
MEYRFFSVDAFTKIPFSGNRAGVVLDCYFLKDNQMLDIAKEVNASETAFIMNLAKNQPIQIRYFTTSCEVPICGHATIASFYTLAKQGYISEGNYKLKTLAGIKDVEVIKEKDDYLIGLHQDCVEYIKNINELKKQVCTGLNIDESELLSDLPITIYTTGNPKAIIPVISEEVLDKITINKEKLIALSSLIDCTGFHVIALNNNDTYDVAGRMFAPASGIEEDPVTGNSVGPIVQYLLDNELINGDNIDLTIKQGQAIEKLGYIKVNAKTNGKKIEHISYYGNATVTIDGRIYLKDK